MARRACVVLLVAAVASAVLGAPSGADARTARVKVGIPSPGHITFHATRITVRRAGRPPLPTRIRLRPVRPKALPSSVRVLWATRVIPQKRKVTYSTFVVVVNKARTGTARASQAPVAEVRLEHYLYLAPARLDDDDFSAQPLSPFKAGGGVSVKLQATIINADNAPLSEYEQLEALVDKDWMVRRQPALHNVVDLDLEPQSGTYGGSAPEPKRIRVNALVAMMVAIARNVPIPEVAARIENQLGIDIDGDGDYGAPDCEYGTYQSPPKEITVPPVGEASSVGFDTPIPNASYYDARHGYRNGGCKWEDKFNVYERHCNSVAAFLQTLPPADWTRRFPAVQWLPHEFEIRDHLHWGMIGHLHHHMKFIVEKRAALGKPLRIPPTSGN